MTRFVLDASVVVKWYVEEIQTPAALLLLEGEHEFLAPDLLPKEVGNAFLKKLRLGEMQSAIAERALADIQQLIDIQPVHDLTWRALTFALDQGRSIYDSFYIVLAMRERCALVTADERLYNAVSSHLPGVLLWIDDLMRDGSRGPDRV